MKHKKCTIGLDIGVTSVGWCIMDNDHNIVNMGVRLFNDCVNTKGQLLNQNRRQHRSQRRRIRRIKHRKQELLKWFVKNNLAKSVEDAQKKVKYKISDFDVKTPIELKIKALEEKVTDDELIAILFHYIHHRGYFYITEEEFIKSKESLIENEKELPSKIIHKFYKENGWYKGSKSTLSIPAVSYIEEIKLLLKKQGKNDEFINSYLKIFNMVRDFSKGPGSEKSPTPYGLYRKLANNEIVKIGNNLWDENIGKCTYYPEEKRAGKNSPYAELFNLLNDLNNLYFFNDYNNKLSEEEKTKILASISKNILKNKTKKITLETDICRILNERNELNDAKNKSDLASINDISGYRVVYSRKKDKTTNKKNKTKKYKITELKNFQTIAIFLHKNKIINLNEKNIFLIETINVFNNLFDELAKEHNVLKRIDILKEKYKDKNIPEKNLIEFLKKLKGTSNTHSLSVKAIKEYIQYGIKNNGNQMQYFSKKINELDNNNSLKNKKYVPKTLFKDAIVSPTVKRAFNQAIKVVNKIIKFYSNDYDIEKIIIEVARDRNSYKEKKRIADAQERNEEQLNEVLDELSNGDENKKKEYEKISKTKLKLWKEQDGKDIYDGEAISKEQLLSPGALNIDHIIPISLSANSKMSNLVLTKSIYNSDKGDKTPYQWLSSKGKYEEFKRRVLLLDKISDNKKNYLLFENDPSYNIENFIDRNLVDTRYACKLVLNTLQGFFKSNNKFLNTTVSAINGSVINYCRYNLFINNENKVLFPKNREIYYHHAVDAAILCYLGMNKNISRLASFETMINKGKENDKYVLYDKKTKEKIDLNSTFSYTEETKKVCNEIDKYINDNLIKFSRKLNKKFNRKLSDETIYSLKWKDDVSKDNIRKGMIVEKINLIVDKTLDKNKKKKFEKIFTSNYERYKNDKLFEELKVIYNKYKNSNENPFHKYMKEKYPEAQPKFIELENKNKVKCIRIDGDNKDTSNIIILKSHTKNNSNKSGIMLDLYALKILVFIKDKNSKSKGKQKNNYDNLVIVPVNQKIINLKNKNLIDDEKIKEELKNTYNVNPEKYLQKEYIELHDGTILLNKENPKFMFYCNCGGKFKANAIEIKPVYCSVKELEAKKKQIVKPISKIAQEYYICEVDELGNIYNKKDILDLLNEKEKLYLESLNKNNKC